MYGVAEYDAMRPKRALMRLVVSRAHDLARMLARKLHTLDSWLGLYYLHTSFVEIVRFTWSSLPRERRAAQLQHIPLQSS